MGGLLHFDIGPGRGYSALRNASNALSVQVHSETDASLASSRNCRQRATGLGRRQAANWLLGMVQI